MDPRLPLPFVGEAENNCYILRGWLNPVSFIEIERELRVREKMPVEPYPNPGSLLAKLHHLMKRLLPNGKMEKAKQNPQEPLF
ncbi:hypothetical protein [Thermostichus sp. MS-CIW-25]